MRNRKSKRSECSADASQSTVDENMKNPKVRASARKKHTSSTLDQGGSQGMFEAEVRTENEAEVQRNEPAPSTGNITIHAEGEAYEKRCTLPIEMEEMEDSDWEEGYAPSLGEISLKGMTIEFSESPDSSQRKVPRRASAEEKELAELMHRVHLLCLIARGRLIDSACDDPLIQASLISLLPSHLLKMMEVKKVTAKSISPFVTWFHNHFRVRSPGNCERSVQLALANALETQEGTPEEIAALSVALFRALKLTARFVSVLDVISLKPGLYKAGPLHQVVCGDRRGIFNAPTVMVSKAQQAYKSPFKSFSCKQKSDDAETSKCPSAPEFQCDIAENSGPESSEVSKRKGDLEFEMQMEMALSATAFEFCEKNPMLGVNESGGDIPNVSSPIKRRKIVNEECQTLSQEISTAVGAKKVGSSLYWAEVYCDGENLTGRWVHVDAINAVVDGEQNVEAAAAACKMSLRYVVAFAGCGAKDVTRRYCMKWHKIESKRTDPDWWNAVLAPLRELESGATGGGTDMPEEAGCGQSSHFGKQNNAECSSNYALTATRSSLEDLELETRALTEPLPTNQQAYKNHQLYALERWLTKYQILRPKGPVLGFCSGHPVYPRTCVQILKTKERWMREGLQVKANESPVKVLKQSGKARQSHVYEADNCEESDLKGVIELYGKWQLEPLNLPCAENGIVPKNERGQVDVWSEKCLPPGTVHLKLPRVYSVAKRLEIDYAPAMVGFEFRSGRAMPVYDGIVVCSEFKDVMLEAYAEEEERRKEAERKKNEREALSRWYQLLSSILTRQRLTNCYGEALSSKESVKSVETNEHDTCIDGSRSEDQHVSFEQVDKMITKSNTSLEATDDHEHVFLPEDQSFDEESSLLTKRCRCGFSVQVEEL